MKELRIKKKIRPKKLIEIIESTLEELGFELEYYDQEEDLVIARTPATLRSFGEKIEIGFELNNSIAKIFVESRLPGIQLFSWGKNSENEGRLSELLEKKIRKL